MIWSASRSIFQACLLLLKTETRLGIDPYSIERWREDLEAFPEVNWSDMIMYLTATPSEYTREAIKVLFVSQTINVLRLCHLNIGLERNA